MILGLALIGCLLYFAIRLLLWYFTRKFIRKDIDISQDEGYNYYKSEKTRREYSSYEDFKNRKNRD